MREAGEIRRDMTAVKAEMKAKGIRRISCFNGGLHGEVYSLNAKMFALETEMKTAQAACKCSCHPEYSQASELDADQYDADLNKMHNT